ncbi:3-hydroxyanthranilic acid dioxygenase [Circinella umbellata]|nr:3-hydroxyanthranilic acid dioxygenase [Circinella umbellata]
MLLPPINFTKWLAENEDKLQPPVNNHLLFRGDDTIVMVVGGPNKRTDYHINETEEWFYQIKGEIIIKVVDNGVFRDIHVGEGNMFLLPANTPHNPVRFVNTVGIVIERVRLPHHIDTLRWYCENTECREIVYQDSFHCTDLGTQLKPIIELFASDEKLRTCKKCGTVNHAK